MSTLEDCIVTLLLAGKGAWMSKHDLCEAFQNLPVQVSQFVKQAIRILGCIFLALKNTYGDKQACHRFSRVHEVLLRYLIIPQTNIDPNSVDMVVDDVTVIVPGFAVNTKLEEFDKTYRETIARLGYSTKPHDPKGFKAFTKLQIGEILGFIINADTHHWSLSVEKTDKIIEALECAYNHSNINQPKPITLKQAQRIDGKLTALAACWPGINTWLTFINGDVARYLRENPKQNRKAQHLQRQNFFFSKQARSDIKLLRALLCNINNHWIPIQNPDKTPPLMFDVTAYTDASAKVDLKPGEPNPSLGLLIPTQYGVIPRAVSFPVPIEFLKSKDDKTYNYGNTQLIEGLAILASIIRFPNTFKGKTVNFYTDSLSLVAAYKKGRTSGLYKAYLLRTLNVVADLLQCKLHITWQRRRSDSYTAAADDLTHQQFEGVPANVRYRKVETLPDPIATTLNTSVDFTQNTFHLMLYRVIKYLYPAK